MGLSPHFPVRLYGAVLVKTYWLLVFLLPIESEIALTLSLPYWQQIFVAYRVRDCTYFIIATLAADPHI
jgi:hypothetical protein